MEFETILTDIDKLTEELDVLESEITINASSLFNNFLNKVFATGMSTQEVLEISEFDNNTTKNNPTDTESNQIPVKDKINNKEIPYENSIINEVQ
jgi:hypothetical protein